MTLNDGRSPSSLMKLSPSWETANCAATQELPNILWNPKIHYRVHKPFHWSLSSARSILSTPSHPISLRSILILSPPTSWSWLDGSDKLIEKGVEGMSRHLPGGNEENQGNVSKDRFECGTSRIQATTWAALLGFDAFSWCRLDFRNGDRIPWLKFLCFFSV
jgi:hypothetical protein